MAVLVIMQPYYFPYRNYYGLVQAADIFVFYDDVQFVRGFQNRNQLRVQGTKRFFTVPVLSRRPRYQRIDEAEIDQAQPWVKTHLDLIRRAYRSAPRFDALWPWLKDFYGCPWNFLADLSIASIIQTTRLLGLPEPCWLRSSQIGFRNSGRNDRIVEICRELGATTYLCGPAAQCYLDTEALARAGVQVRWHEPSYRDYPQFDGAFDHFVSIIDLLMNCGPESAGFLQARG